MSCLVWIYRLFGHVLALPYVTPNPIPDLEIPSFHGKTFYPGNGVEIEVKNIATFAIPTSLERDGDLRMCNIIIV